MQLTISFKTFHCHLGTKRLDLTENLNLINRQTGMDTGLKESPVHFSGASRCNTPFTPKKQERKK